MGEIVKLHNRIEPRLRALVEPGGEAKRKEAELVPHQQQIIDYCDRYGLSAYLSYCTRAYQLELDRRKAEKSHD